MFEEKSWAKHLPPTDEVVNEANLQEFFATMFERQEIWYKRTILQTPAPWTTDPIFANHRFTNVYRELDRSSQYLIHNGVIPHDINQLRQVLFNIIVHRIFNKAETFLLFTNGVSKSYFGSNVEYTEGGYPVWEGFRVEAFLQDLLEIEESGIKTLNQEAYKINTYMWGGEPRWYAYTKHIIAPFAEPKLMEQLVRAIQYGSADDVVKVLRTPKGAGMFLVHEWYQDICDLNAYFFKGQITKFDKNSWSNVGPGASLGLRLLFPALQPKDYKLEAMLLLAELASTYLENIGRRKGTHFKYLNWNIQKGEYYCTKHGEINAHMCEMFACEYAKYFKMKIAAGKQRQKFISK